MRIFCLSMGFLCTAAVAGHAQTFNWGVKGGFTAATSKQDSEFATSFHWRPAFHAGLFGRYQFATKSLSAQSELLYAQAGDRYSSKYLAGSFAGRTNASYLALPVLLRYEVLPHLTLQAGPQLSWLLRARNLTETTDNNGQVVETTDREIDSYWHRLDFGAVAGLGYQLNDHLGLGLRYYWGLRDIAKNPGNETTYNRSGQLSLEYTF